MGYEHVAKKFSALCEAQRYRSGSWPATGILKSYMELYPFASHWLTLDGGRLHYLDEGLSDAPVLVMLHGNPTWSFYYRSLILALRDRYRVIAPDHMGCGLSDKPQDYAYNLAQHIDNLEALLTSLGIQRVGLVLHDWGGAIGMGYATRYPERVERFVVFNTAAFFLPRVPLRIRLCRVPILGEFLVRGLNGFSLAALLFATSQQRRFSRAVRAGYLAPYNNWRNRIAVYRFVRDIPLEPGHPTRATLAAIEAGLAQFRRHPMLILWGADDFCFTRRHFLPRWRSLFPQAEVQVYQGAGHYVVEDAIERIVPRLSAFLAASDNKKAACEVGA